MYLYDTSIYMHVKIWLTKQIKSNQIIFLKEVDIINIWHFCLLLSLSPLLISYEVRIRDSWRKICNWEVLTEKLIFNLKYLWLRAWHITQVKSDSTCYVWVISRLLSSALYDPQELQIYGQSSSEHAAGFMFHWEHLRASENYHMWNL